MRARLACLVAAGLLLAACSSNPDRDRPENPFKKKGDPFEASTTPQSDRELHLEADGLYRRAQESIVSQDWTNAKTRLDKLIASYPYSDYATQAEMEKVFVEYKSAQYDDATAGADRFLRSHPRSGQAEYIQYLHGLISYNRDEGFLDTLGIGGGARRDVSSARRAYDDFALLIQRYPTSKYAGDARRRMIYLRNRVAEHDLSVAQYYQRRGAFIAAARRAENVIAEYPGAPASLEALEMLQSCYTQAGLNEAAADAAKLVELNLGKKAEAAKSAALPLRIAAAETAASDFADSEAPPPPAPSPRPGLMTRFVRLFDFADTSKPEHQYTLVLPGKSAPAAIPEPATGGGTPESQVAARHAEPAALADSTGNDFGKALGLSMSIGPPNTADSEATVHSAAP